MERTRKKAQSANASAARILARVQILFHSFCVVDNFLHFLHPASSNKAFENNWCQLNSPVNQNSHILGKICRQYCIYVYCTPRACAPGTSTFRCDRFASTFSSLPLPASFRFHVGIGEREVLNIMLIRHSWKCGSLENGLDETAVACVPGGRQSK